ncbi:TadE/TadG family type IV pilus assembly protein [Pararhizobium sp.]|uniref:TadE/TadG family type IV pilus assembly protein n=1 Tax=Pararhizobium sp. TaxID=1977563 RepID=UPI0027190FBB|nr:TadE/TadG family type IV pilus assembly protein [Pararhizobium sp.]MDO9417852.1 pilus assembly protein [Pararhizobium sp.]
MTSQTASKTVQNSTAGSGARSRRWSWCRFGKDRSGATAIEFAILSIPFFMIIFASLETFAALTGEQLLANAGDTLSRKLRTGEISNIAGRSTSKTEAEFRKMVCDEIAIMLPCEKDKLYIDVKSYSSFAAIPVGIPLKGTKPYVDLNDTGFSYAPGGPGTINVVRIYYRWQIITDLIRPYVTNLRPAGKTVPTDYLIVATNAFRIENYP